MEGIQHFRRRKCIVLNLNPIKTADGEDHTIRFLANGRSYEIENGKEVDLLEPAYNALESNVRIDHKLSTKVDPGTGDVTHIDNPTDKKQYSVTNLSEWYWPESHCPYDSSGNIVRIDLTKEEIAKAPLHFNMVEKKPEEVKTTKKAATKKKVEAK